MTFPDYRTLAADLGLKDDKAAMNLLVTAKRHFTRVLRQNVREYVTRSHQTDQYVNAVAEHLNSSSSNREENQKAATQLTEQAISELVEEEIRSLRQILADSRGAVPVEIDRSRSGTSDQYLFLDRLASASDVNHRAFEWGLDDDECTDDIIFASLLDTPLKEIGVGESGTIRGALTAGNASVDVLKSLKHWIKLQRLHDDRTYARQFASAIYYGTIATALIFLDIRISSLPARQLIYGINSVVDENWMDPGLSTVLTRARSLLRKETQ